MKKEDRELLKFVYNPKYREKILEKNKNDADKKYQENISAAKEEKKRLFILRQRAIERIEDSRWEKYANGNLKINFVEGAVLINENKALFTSIKSAEINIQEGFRTVTTENSIEKKKPSVGGAVVGGLVDGKVGAAIGSVALNKTKTTSKSYTDAIPTCNHIGIIIDVDGFKQEITIMQKQVDQQSREYELAYDEAQKIVMKLREVSQTPVPESFLPVEESESVKDIEQKIEIANEHLEAAINNKPKYNIPAVYRTSEQSYMTDKEYLDYLYDEDKKRENSESNSDSRKSYFKFSLSDIETFFVASILSLFLGVLGIILSAFSIGVISGMVGLVLGIVGFVTSKSKKILAASGICVSSVAIVIYFILLFLNV